MKNPSLILLLFAASASLAQELTPTPPLKVVPAPTGHWAIYYKYAREKRNEKGEIAPSFPPHLKSREYLVTGDTALLRETYLDGSKSDIYQAGNFELRRPPESAHIIVLDLTVQALTGQLFRKIYPGLEWVHPQHFAGVAEAYGQKCFWYREARRQASQTHQEKEQADIPTDSYQVKEAWISVETGLPVAFKNDEFEGIYAFGAPPAEKVQLPADFQKFLRAKFKPGPPPGQAASLLKSDS